MSRQHLPDSHLKFMKKNRPIRICEVQRCDGTEDCPRIDPASGLPMGEGDKSWDEATCTDYANVTFEPPPPEKKTTTPAPTTTSRRKRGHLYLLREWYRVFFAACRAA